MTDITCFLAALLLIGYVASKSVTIDDELQKAFVGGHNDYRKNEGASNMNELVWDAKLSKTAADWISRCNFEHQMKGWGENLWYATANIVKDTKSGIKDALKDWFDEKFLGPNSYSCGNRCHYTQLVWAKTRKVGCAIEKCGYLQAFGSNTKDAIYIACFYDPKGNMNGEKIYETGAACSKCGKGQTCNNGLCAGEAEPEPVVCEDKNKDCADWVSFGECKANRKYMEKNCAKSCGVCEGGNGDLQLDCVDNDSGCAAWAKRGECRRNPSYMNAECRKSCKQC